MVEGVTLNPGRGRTDAGRDGVRALRTGVVRSGPSVRKTVCRGSTLLHVKGQLQ